MLYLPNQTWSVTPKGTLDATAGASSSTGKVSDRQIALAADGVRIPVIYGIDRRGALIANIVTDAQYVYVQCVWGLGEIEGVQTLSMGNDPLSAAASVHHYLGTAGQAVDAWLASAFASNGIAYADALPGIAYSVIRAPLATENFDPTALVAIVKGLKLHDPRTGLVAWSDNPALALAHFIGTFEGRVVDADSVSAAADACDEIVGGQRRRRLGLSLAQAQTCDAWRDTLRTYAGCFVVQRSNGLHLVPDRPASPVRTFDHDAGDIASLGPLKKRPRAEAPTVVKIKWTDTSVIPWRDRTAVAYAAGVLAGTVERRESEISLPGIQSASQAQREAIERLNKLWLADLSFPLGVFDDGLQVEPGDVVAVTHPIGLSSKLMRVGGIDNTGPGRWTLQLVEYDPAAYSDAVVSDPSTPDTSLPSPAAPVPLEGLSVAEEVFQMQDGTWSSRLRATWPVPAYPWLSGYRIELRVGAAIVQTGTLARWATSWPSTAVQEGVPHQLDVYIRSSIGAESAAASVVITPEGKFLPPGNVPSLAGYEVGGEVRLRWPAAVDIDIWRYEIRWGAPGVSWAAATLLDRVDALSLVSKDVPAGSWDFLVCALDSVGQYSPTPARRSITVTLDAASILVDRHDYSAPTASGMQEYSLWPTDPFRRWVSEDDVLMADKFTNALTDYPEPMAAYAAGANSWQTETHDFGIALSGNWTAELAVTPLAGTVDQYLDLSPDGSTWSAHAGLTAKTGGRFARLRVDAVGAVLVLLPVAQLRIDAIPRQEEGIARSSAAGPSTVTLAGVYALSKGLPQITVAGTGFATATVDNIVVGTPTTFDVYVFDDSGTIIERDFGYVWKGI